MTAAAVVVVAVSPPAWPATAKGLLEPAACFGLADLWLEEARGGGLSKQTRGAGAGSSETNERTGSPATSSTRSAAVATGVVPVVSLARIQEFGDDPESGVLRGRAPTDRQRACSVSGAAPGRCSASPQRFASRVTAEIDKFGVRVRLAVWQAVAGPSTCVDGRSSRSHRALYGDSANTCR
jgi:hypothetical protein